MGGYKVLDRILLSRTTDFEGEKPPNLEYIIRTALPEGVDPKVCSVLLVTDGEQYFDKAVEDISAAVEAKRLLANYAIVSVGYEEPWNSEELLDRRAFDFLEFSKTKFPKADRAHPIPFGLHGDAVKFCEFIVDDVLPTARKRHGLGTDAETILFGHSFGGLFAMTALRQSNHITQAIISSPSAWLDKRPLVNIGPQIGPIFVSVGTNDAPGIMNHYAQVRNALADETLNLHSRRLHDENHLTAGHVALVQGLLWIDMKNNPFPTGQPALGIDQMVSDTDLNDLGTATRPASFESLTETWAPKR